MGKKFFATLAWSLAAIAAIAADIDMTTQIEIDHMFARLQQSNCRFDRNGKWYGPERAVQHVNRKYQYLLKKKAIQSAENFIDRAASRSSTTGKPYWVKCGESAAMKSADWFQAELEGLRRQNEMPR